tara:strand:- start:2745 stop:2981 length:237 start_codon:yes stop_codon:yes gene_type:complete
MEQVINEIASIKIEHIIANDEETVRIVLTDTNGYENTILVSCLGKFDAVSFMRSDGDTKRVKYTTLSGNEFQNIHAAK